MRRSVVSILIPLLVVLVLALPTQAAVTWCKTDPTVRLNGTLVDITIGIPLEYVPLVNGPVRFEIQTPPEVARQVIFTDLGYNGYGVEVTFTDLDGEVKDGSFDTKIMVKVPIDETQLDPSKIPAELTVLPANDLPVLFEGTAKLTKGRLSIKGSY